MEEVITILKEFILNRRETTEEEDITNKKVLIIINQVLTIPTQNTHIDRQRLHRQVIGVTLPHRSIENQVRR